MIFTSLLNASAQEPARRIPARSLTSEDLLNRPTIYIPPAASSTSVSSSAAVRNAGNTYYRDPSGAFTLTFPNNNWRVNTRGASAGRIYNQRSFRRIEAEGFASATVNVYVLTDSANLPLVDSSSLSADTQRELASIFATRFLSSHASVVAVQPVASRAGTGLRIIADQTIARRVAVRAAINVFELKGRLYVVVCCAPPETFDAAVREFDTITNSLASSVARS